jgi:hypothetical protein
MRSTTTSQMCWELFAAWLAVGAGLSLGILGAMSIGLFVLPVAVAAAVVLAIRYRGGDELIGLVSGLGVPLLYVAYLNRSGPGMICTANSAGGQSCTDEWSPWPWVALGAMLLIGGVVLYLARRRVSLRRSQAQPGT